MNFNVLQLISSTKLLIACKRIKNNCFDKFRQNEGKRGENQNNPTCTEVNQAWRLTNNERPLGDLSPWDPPRTIPRLACPQFPLSRISHGCILCLLQRLAVFYKLHL